MSAILPGLTRTPGAAALALGLAPVLATIEAAPGDPSGLGEANTTHYSRVL